MVKRPRGSAALVPPCWSSAIWPVFEDQSCNFLFSSVFFCSAWLWKIVSDECYKSHIQNDSFIPFYATFLYNQMSTSCSHPLPVFLYSSYITLLSGFTDTIHFPLFIPLMFLLLISSNSPPSHCFSILSPSSSSFLPLPQRGTHLCDRLLLTHSTSAALQMRVERARGESVMQDPENRV